MNQSQKNIYDKYVSIQRPHEHNLSSEKVSFAFTPNQFNELQKITLPRKLIINSTNICNANCIFCGYQYKIDKNSTIDIDTVRRVTIEYAKFHPDSFISFTPTVGDPLIDKDIFIKVNMAKEAGIKRIQFYTNGILLKKRLDELLSSKLDNLEISLAEFHEENYKKIYRSKNYSLVLDGVHCLLKRLKQEGKTLPVKLNFRSSRPLSQIIKSEDFIKYIKPYLTDYIFMSDTEEYDNWMGLISQNDLIPGMKIGSPETSIKSPCIRLFDLQLLENGDIRLCGCRFNKTVFDDLIIGNINKNSLEEIWFSEKSYELRKDFFKGITPEVCKNCSYYEEISAHSKRKFFIKDLRYLKKIQSQGKQ